MLLKNWREKPINLASHVEYLFWHIFKCPCLIRLLNGTLFLGGREPSTSPFIFCASFLLHSITFWETQFFFAYLDYIYFHCLRYTNCFLVQWKPICSLLQTCNFLCTICSKVVLSCFFNILKEASLSVFKYITIF